ncbi:transposase [Vibrio diabolicus]|nr:MULTISPECIES: transposase [Vibrio harveyi group]MDV5036889.1 transposase [Vibrio diabolicus]MDV5061988.1 transposase [Vibrio diabolicus]
MPKSRYKTTNWKQCNKALINRGSLTFWIDEEVIAEWKQNKQGKRGRPRRFSDLAIATDGKTSFLYAIDSAARFYRLII